MKCSCFVLQSVGKGSLWRVCPEYRPALLEVLRKTHYCHRTNSNLLNKPVLWVWCAFLWYITFIRLNIELSDVFCTTSEELMTRSLGYWYMHIWPPFWTGWRQLIMGRTSWVRLWKFQVSHNWTQLLNWTLVKFNILFSLVKCSTMAQNWSLVSSCHTNNQLHIQHNRPKHLEYHKYSIAIH